MAKEIERKYLMVGDEWRLLAKGVLYRQGYLSSLKERTVRVRIVEDKAYLTIKGITVGATRLEFEYLIPVDDAKQLLNLCEKPIIEKKRYAIPHDNIIIEVDEFLGDNKGLIVAEIELKNESQQVKLPAWLGEEVTKDPKYYNANLVNYPYKNWRE